jgi:hypothetical protein
MPEMMPDEVLGMCRLRQWSADRAALRHGAVSQAKTAGWTDRPTRSEARSRLESKKLPCRSFPAMVSPGRA